MHSESLFSREEVLSGLNARRARTLLFLIESRTARLAAQARQAMTLFRSEQAAAEDELTFLTAFSEGRDPPLKPSIQDLEHFSAQWARLVPKTPPMQAAVAHAFGAKYRFTYEAVPGIRSALGLDDRAVQDAFLRQYQAPVVTIYQASAGGGERLRWASTRLARSFDSLPPIWTSFALTLTETVGGGILALPIALAGIGPLPGVLLVIVMGLINVLTITCAAEAAARSGTVRYGSGFMGRMVGDYLGNLGSTVLTVGVAVFSALSLLACYIGFAAAMSGVIGLPQSVWVVALFLVSLYFLRRESLNATIASALVVGAVSIAALLLLSLLAFTILNPTNLLYSNVPFVNGEPFRPALLQLIFGVVLAAFFGHMSVNNCARVVLRRDGSARSLIGGAAAAQVVTIGLYCIWELAVAGAVPPAVLAADTGTALAPLTARLGPIAVVLSTVYAVLTLAMGSIHSSLPLFNLVRERLPTQTRLTVTLPRRRGQLVFTPRSNIRDLFRRRQKNTRLGVTYLGLDDLSQAAACPRLRVDLNLGDKIHAVEIKPGTAAPVAPQGRQATAQGRERYGAWSESALTGLLPDLYERGIRLSLEVLEASPAYIRFSVASPMAVRYEGQWESASPDLSVLLECADTDRRIWKWLSRQPGFSTVAEIAVGARVDEPVAQAALMSLSQKELVSGDLAGGEIRYRARFGVRRGRLLPGLLGSESAPPPRGQHEGVETRGVRSRSAFWAGLNPRSRYWVCAMPIVAAFLLTEGLLLSGRASFSEIFSLLGVLLVSLLAGVFPILLLVASRRKGDVVPGISPRLVGNPIILALVYLLYVSGVLLYGLIIWQQPIQRAAALGVVFLAIAMPVIMLRRGAFRRRAVVELRASVDEDLPAVFAVSAAGEPRTVEVRLRYDTDRECFQAASGEIPDFAALRAVSFRSPAGTEDGVAHLPRAVRDVKIWTHALTRDGDDQALPAAGELSSGDVITGYDLGTLGGQVVLPLAGAGFQVQVAFQGPSKDGR